MSVEATVQIGFFRVLPAITWYKKKVAIALIIILSLSNIQKPVAQINYTIGVVYLFKKTILIQLHENTTSTLYAFHFSSHYM